MKSERKLVFSLKVVNGTTKKLLFHLIFPEFSLYIVVRTHKN